MHRGFRAAGFHEVVVERFRQHVRPVPVRLFGEPRPKHVAGYQSSGERAEPVAQPSDLAQAPEERRVLACHLHGDGVTLAEAAQRVEIPPVAGDHRASPPVPIGGQLGQAPQFRQGGDCLRTIVAAYAQDLHPTPAHGVA